MSGNTSEAGAEPGLVQVAQEYADAGFSGDVYATEDGQLRCGSCDTPPASTPAEGDAGR